MKLGRLIPVLSEYGKHSIVDWDSLNELAHYDGKDALPHTFDKWNVMEICAADDTVRIYISDKYERA